MNLMQNLNQEAIDTDLWPLFNLLDGEPGLQQKVNFILEFKGPA